MISSVTGGMLTLMVCTVLTGTRLMASDPKMCPPTWNAAIGKVPRSIDRVGRDSLAPNPM